MEREYSAQSILAGEGSGVNLVIVIFSSSLANAKSNLFINL